MMWPDEDEPLYDERIDGEMVRFFWRQEEARHVVRAEWHFGSDPWDVKTCEGIDPIRHRAIENATEAVTEMIVNSKKAAEAKQAS